MNSASPSFLRSRFRASALLVVSVLAITPPLRAVDVTFPLGGTNVTLSEVTSEVGARFQSMRRNPALNQWNLDLCLTNKSHRAMPGPLVVVIESFSGTTGPLQPDGLLSGTPSKAWYDFTPQAGAGQLWPGETTAKRVLTLGYNGGAPTLNARFFANLAAAEPGLAFVRTLDALGQPLPGVDIVETGPTATVNRRSDPDFAQATLGGADGQHTWQFSAPGHVNVWRRDTLQRGVVSVVFNPRLTPLASPVVLPLAGGDVTNADGSVRLQFAPGSFAQSAAVSLTPLSAQTVPALLPPGWSPVQAFHLELPAAPAAPVTAQLHSWDTLGTSETVALARWNPAAFQWDVLETLTRGAAETVTATLPGAGSYALAAPDTGLIAPPLAQAGMPLTASSAVFPGPNTLTAGGVVNPAISLASRVAERVTATAQLAITNSGGALPSGLPLRCEVREQYELRDGTRRQSPAYENFLVGYQRPGDAEAATLHSVFPMRPRLLFGTETLAAATVSAEVLTPTPFGGRVLDARGGQAPVQGLTLVAAPGDLAQRQAIILRRLDPTNFAASAGLPVVAAFDLSLSGVETGRRLALQVDGAPSNSLLVLTKVLSSADRFGLQPIERLQSDAAGRLTSLEPASGERLPGLNCSGQFLVVTVTNAHGLVTGIARNSSGQPAAGLPVRLTGQPWLTYSDSNGAYRLIAPAGTSTVDVTDPTTGDHGQASVNLPDAGTVVSANLSATPAGPRVVSINPTNGAARVPRVSPIAITFSEPINPGSLGVNGAQMLNATGGVVTASVSLNLPNTVLTLLPVAQLAANTAHTIVLSSNLADPTGLKIEGPRQFTFTTESDTLDRVGAQVVSYEPVNGQAAMTGSPGTAEPESPVILVNETTGQTATILSKPDGSFTNSIPADVDDLLSAVLVNRNGTRNTIPVSYQIYRDGSVGVFESGGIVEAAGEFGRVQMAIEFGSLKGKSKLHLEPQPLETFRRDLGTNQPEAGGRILSAFRLRWEGAELTHGADVSLPIRLTDLELEPGESPTNRVFALCKVIEIDGTTVFEVVDKLEYENGRLVSHSPPFQSLVPDPGLNTFTAIMMGFFRLRTVVVGRVVVAETGAGDIDESSIRSLVAANGTRIRPLPSALVFVDRAGGMGSGLRAGAITARANSQGFYSALVPFNAFDPDPVLLRAYHPAYSGQRVVKVFTPGGLAAGPTIGTVANLVFRIPTGSSADGIPPQVLPIAPADVLPTGTNVSLGFRLIDETSRPTLMVLAFDPVASRPFASGVAFEPGDVRVEVEAGVDESPTQVRFPANLHARIAGLVVLLAVARDEAGNTATNRFSFYVGQSAPPAAGPLSPGDPNDHQPPTVITAWPDQDELIGRGPDARITFRFSEPVDPVLATNADVVLVSPPGVSIRPILSGNQQELQVFLGSLAPGQSYQAVLQPSHVRDLSDNHLSVSRIVRWRTPPAQSVELEGTAGAVGVVSFGANSFTLTRTSSEGELVSSAIGTTTNNQVQARLRLPFYPRCLVKIPEFTFRRTAASPVETKPLLVVAGGNVGMDVAGQLLWVIDVSNPTNLSRVASAVASPDPVAAFTVLRWQAPFLFVNEANPDGGYVHQVNLQAFILGGNQQTGSTFDPGLDANGDGDFVDEGDRLPTPQQRTFFGLENVVSIAPRRFLTDFDVQDGGGTLAGVLPAVEAAPARFQLLVDRGSTVDWGNGDAGTLEYPPGGPAPTRVLLDLNLPVPGPVGVRALRAALVAAGSSLDILDIDDPSHISRRATIRLPRADGLDPGTIFTLNRSGPDEYAVGTSRGIYLIRRSLLGLANGLDAPTLAIERIISGIAYGRTATATDLEFAATDGGDGVVRLREPYIRMMRSLGEPVTNALAIIGAGPAGARRFVDSLVERPFVVPASIEDCGRSIPSLSSNEPALPGFHCYLVLRASGRLGPSLPLALESLGAGHELLAPPGRDYPPILHSSSVGALGLAGMHPIVTPLLARRLSADTMSDDFNTFVSDPILVVRAPLTAAQREYLNQDGRRRAVLWAGDFIRCSIDPTAGDGPLEPFRGRLVGRRYMPAVQQSYRSLRAEFLDSPNPSFASAAPRFAGVDLQSGEIRKVEPDAFIEGREQALSLTRVYESRSRYVGPFGRGWDFNLNVRILELNDDLPTDFTVANCRPGDASPARAARSGDVIFYDGAGNALRFRQISEGNGNLERTPLYAADPAIPESVAGGGGGIARYYESPEGIHSVLCKLADGTWWMVHPGGQQMFFDGAGRITKSRGRSRIGEILWTYRADGRLDRVTGDRGIYLEFGYYHPPPAVIHSRGFLDTPSDLASEWGRICKVRAWSPLNNETEIAYDYDEDGNLAEARPRSSPAMVHAYDRIDPNLLLKAGRGDGSEEPGLAVAYDPKGLVSAITVDGETMTFAGAKETIAERSALPASQVSFTRVNTARTVTYDIDEKGRPTSFANRPFEADDEGRPVTVADDLHQGRLIYDVANPVFRFRGNLIRTERSTPLGARFVTEVHYDGGPLNAIDRLTDVNGVVTTVESDIRSILPKEKSVIGGLVTREDRLNDFAQLIGSSLASPEDTFQTIVQFGNAAADLDLPTAEGPADGVLANRTRNTLGQIITAGFASRQQEFRYNDDGQIEEITGGGAPEVSFTYEDGLPVEQVITGGSLGVTNRYEYEDARFKAKATRLTVAETGLPEVETIYTYDDESRLVEMSAAGEAFTYEYDGVRLTNETGPGVLRSMSFLSDGRSESLTENGITINFRYDDAGRLAESEQQGAITRWTYDDAGDRLRTRLMRKEVIDAVSNSVLLSEDYAEYDAAGRLQVIVGNGGRIRRFSWFPDGQMKSLQIDGHIVQSAARDSAGRLTKTRLNDVEVAFGDFDPEFGAARFETVRLLPSNRTVNRELFLDGRGRLVAVASGGGTNGFDYDDFGNLILTRDPDGVVRRVERSPGGRVLSITFGDGTSATNSYTGHLRLESVGTAVGNLDYEYGDDGLIRRIRRPDGDETELNRRNDFFLPEEMRFGTGEVVQTLNYDENTGRQESTVAGADGIYYTHDALGRQLAVTRGGETVGFLYNTYGEPSGETTFAGTWAVNLDSRNRLLSERYPSGLTVNFSPDEYGLPSSAPELGITGLRWLGAGIPTEVTFTGGLVLERTYDAGLSVDHIHYRAPAGGNPPRPVAGYEYALTAAGRVLRETCLHDNGRSGVYERHPAAAALRIQHIGFATASNTLASAEVALTNLDYINGELHAPPQGSIQGDPRGYFPELVFDGQRVVEADGIPVLYNGRGAVTNGPLYVRLPGNGALTLVAAVLHYDAFGLLQLVVRGDGVEVSYRRDGLGRIIERRVSGPPHRCRPVHRRYVWKGLRLLEEYQDDGQGFGLLRRYGYVGDTLLVIQRADTGGGTLTSVVPILNMLGSVGGYLAPDGSMLEHIRYTAYGYPVFPDNARTSTQADTLFFHGAFFDVETGLYQMGQRNLHPILARFLQRDAELFKESLAFYSAFNGDPASRRDLEGTVSGLVEGDDPLHRVLALKKTATEPWEGLTGLRDAASDLIPVLNAVRGHEPDDEDDRVNPFGAAARTSSFLLKAAELGKQAIGADEFVVERARQFAGVLQTANDVAEKFSKVNKSSLALSEMRFGTWARDPKNAPDFSSLPNHGAGFSLAKLTTEQRRNMIGSFREARGEKRDEWLMARQERAIALGRGAQSLLTYVFKDQLEDTGGPIHPLGGATVEVSGKLIDAAEAYLKAKKSNDELGKLISRHETLQWSALSGGVGNMRSAVGAAWDLGFSVGKLTIVGVCDPIVAKAYEESVKQWEEDGGWLTTGAGVLSSLGMDKAAYAMQQLHDTDSFSLKPYADVVLRSRAVHQERLQFYLHGVDAP